MICRQKNSERCGEDISKVFFPCVPDFYCIINPRVCDEDLAELRTRHTKRAALL